VCDHLRGQHEAICAAAAPVPAADMTVVFDAGQNSGDNFAHLAGTGLHYIGITAKPWVRRVITWQLDGEQPKDLRLAWGIDTAARAALEGEIFGKHVLITSHDDWPAAEVIAGYRSQSEAEFSFRQPAWKCRADPVCHSVPPVHTDADEAQRSQAFRGLAAFGTRAR
jgi:hypothetical protein